MVSTSTGWSWSRLARQSRRLCTLLVLLAVACTVLVRPLHAQDDPLNKIHVLPPPVKPAPPSGPPPAEGKAALHARPGERIRVDVNLVLVPLIVTDPLNRLVTGLEKNEFFLTENNAPQEIKSFSAEDAPVSIGIVMDLSGSMSNKVVRARESIIEFLRTSNPQDEFFIIGFNDRPELIEDFTSSVDDIEARLQTVRPGRRTALLDAIYYGVNKMKQARYERKALLIVSDGGDNRSRYTESELRNLVRESDTELFSIGIFDAYAATTEERNGPLLLHDLSEETGGQLFRVDDVSDMTDIATKISAELRNQYVIGYKPSDAKRDGKWRKVKVKLVPPPGLPPLTVHARSGYYAPAQ
ncbi:MAG TPA: VWA domain-containing protein [Acidobacteriaceae bacterium]|jgi:Ca-activated chloride channel family protein|nr:VWA domain-containing protein [Acidobacteriaceae bacterium]